MRILLIIGSLLLTSIQAYASDFPAKEVYETISPSVVTIRASKAEGEGMIGAGSIISKKGLIITNAHVVIDKSVSISYPHISVYLKPDKLTGIIKNDLSIKFDAEVMIYSKELDLALLKAKGLPLNINALELADPSEIKTGEEVVAIGHPEQGGFWSLTYGRISGELRDYQGIPGKDMYQTDTSVNRGNSGGPLLDRRGYIVAVNSNIARLGRDGLPITGVNFSIKSSVVKKWLEENGYAIAYGKRPLLEEDRKVATKTLEDKENKEERPEDMERLLTPKRPYDYDALIKAAEKDLEGLMDEMRKKIRR